MGPITDSVYCQHSYNSPILYAYIIKFPSLYLNITQLKHYEINNMHDNKSLSNNNNNNI